MLESNLSIPHKWDGFNLFSQGWINRETCLIYSARGQLVQTVEGMFRYPLPNSSSTFIMYCYIICPICILVAIFPMPAFFWFFFIFFYFLFYFNGHIAFILLPTFFCNYFAQTAVMSLWSKREMLYITLLSNFYSIMLMWKGVVALDKLLF
jgi:hypothetical protein